MAEQPPGPEGQTTFHVDFARLTAGPAAPHATSVSLPGSPAPGAKAAKKKTPTNRSRKTPGVTATTVNPSEAVSVLSVSTPVSSQIQQMNIITAMTVNPSEAVSVPSVSTPVSSQIQQMNIIHDALSSSGFAVIAPPEVTANPVSSLSTAPAMDVAAYQEAPPEVRVETLEMEARGDPMAESSGGQQIPILVGPFTAKDLLSMVPSTGIVLTGEAAPGSLPHPISITRVVPHDLNITPATKVLPAPSIDWTSTESQPVATVQAKDSNQAGSTQTKCTACGVDKTGGVTSAFLETNMEYAEMYQCDVCGQRKLTFKSVDNQPAVTRPSEVAVDTHECSICWRDFKDEDSLKVHQSVTHQPPSSFQCNFCTGVFSYRYECDMHEQFTHDKLTTLKCKLCSKEFVSKKRLKKHATKCWNESGRGDLTSKTGESQEKSAEVDVGEWYNIPVNKTDKKSRLCKKCGRSFKSLRNYTRHIQNFCTKNPYKCEGCEEVFSTKRKLWQHEKQLKKGENHYTCTCGHQFQSKRTFRTHKRLHEGLRPYKCKFCDKGFIALNKCLIHERSHTGEKPYSCKFCGQEYALQESLRVHERKHVHDYRFTCKYCGKGFVKKYTHQIHERNHEGVKPYPCSYCEKAFSRKADCARHELCMHSQGKDAYRFLCSHCGKAFKLKGDLKVHERIHTGEKPHHCDQCQRGFGRASYYNRHMKLYHGKADESMKTAAETLMTVATVGIEQSLSVHMSTVEEGSSTIHVGSITMTSAGNNSGERHTTSAT